MQISNINDLYEKIDWADGISNAMLREGMDNIEDHDVPDDLKDAWEEAAEALAHLTNLMDHYYHEYDTNKEY